MSARALTIVAIAVVLAGPALAQDNEAALSRPARGPMIFDILVLRPLGFARAAVGAVAFLPVAIMTSPMGQDAVDQAWEDLVEIPSDHVFRRSLGDF